MPSACFAIFIESNSSKPACLIEKFLSLKFSFANLIASISLSKARRAPSFDIESHIFLEWPPLPKVASIYLPEGLVIKKSIDSSSNTGE